MSLLEHKDEVNDTLDLLFEDADRLLADGLMADGA